MLHIDTCRQEMFDMADKWMENHATKQEFMGGSPALAGTDLIDDEEEDIPEIDPKLPGGGALSESEVLVGRVEIGEDTDGDDDKEEEE